VRPGGGRKAKPITIKSIVEGYENANDWFKGCVTNSTLFNCIIYKGHINYLPIESIIGKYSIYSNIEPQNKPFSLVPYDNRIKQYNELYHTRYGYIDKMGDPTRRQGMGRMTGSLYNRKKGFALIGTDYATSGYTAQELRVIKNASENLPSDEPLLYPDMYNLQKGVELTKGKKDCENDCPFTSNLYLIFGEWEGYVQSQGGGSKKKRVSNHKKYNKDKLYMKHLNKQRQTKPNKTNKRKKRSKKYTNKRKKNRK
jgi:hypothetical protein